MNNRGDKYWQNEMGESGGNSQQRKHHYGPNEPIQDDIDEPKYGGRPDWKNNHDRPQNNFHKNKRIMSGGSSMSPPPHHANRRVN